MYRAAVRKRPESFQKGRFVFASFCVDDGFWFLSEARHIHELQMAVSPDRQSEGSINR